MEVLKLALESFSVEFKTALAAANRTWAGMPPAQRVSAGSSTAARLNWLKVPIPYCDPLLAGSDIAGSTHSTFDGMLQANDNSVTFMSYADTVSSPFKWMNMFNKAGKLVRPSVASVQSAMADFGVEYGSSNFTIDIVDAKGNASWPIAYMSYLSLKQNVTASDCTNIQELLAFVAWIQTNDACVHPTTPLAALIHWNSNHAHVPPQSLTGGGQCKLCAAGRVPAQGRHRRSVHDEVPRPAGLHIGLPGRVGHRTLAVHRVECRTGVVDQQDEVL